MKEQTAIIINQELCTGCGLCIPVCPSHILSLEDNKAWTEAKKCMECGHCAAICPTQAIIVPGLDAEALSFDTFATYQSWLPYGEFETAQLVRLMRSRRSTRNYTDQPIDRAILEDLVKVGITAPSGTNSQKWTFTILPKRKDVIELGNQVAAYYKKLNHLADKKYLRLFLKLIGKPSLDQYFHKHYKTIREGLINWEQHGIDQLFHGATAAIIVGSKQGASCPMEDAMLATQNILLAAHSMGLGSCLIGFAVEAMGRDPDTKKNIGIPDEEKVYAVIALGYTKEIYKISTGRKKVTHRYYEAIGQKM